MSFGSSEWQEWVVNEDEALPLLKHAYDCGINTWDTVRSKARSLYHRPLIQPALRTHFPLEHC